MKKFILIILVSSAIIFPQSAGKSGLSFLKFGFGARNISMGDAGAVISNDVTSLFYNPSRLAGNKNNEILLMHNQWIQDIRSEILGVKFNLFGLPFALGFNITSIDDIEVRKRAGDAITTFDANYFFGSLSTGFFVTDEISFGTTIKYLYEGLFTDESNGIAFDFGLNYLTPLEGLTISSVIRNLGSMNKLKDEKTQLPNEFRIGPSYKFDLNDSKFSITTGAELLKYLQTEDIHLNLGGEIVYDNIIALRGGYQSGYLSKSFTGGIGLKWGNLNFDYALSPFQLQLGSGHSISLSFKF